jgi:hypothetical protein
MVLFSPSFPHSFFLEPLGGVDCKCDFINKWVGVKNRSNCAVPGGSVSCVCFLLRGDAFAPVQGFTARQAMRLGFRGGQCIGILFHGSGITQGNILNGQGRCDLATATLVPSRSQSNDVKDFRFGVSTGRQACMQFLTCPNVQCTFTATGCHTTRGGGEGWGKKV